MLLLKYISLHSVQATLLAYKLPIKAPSVEFSLEKTFLKVPNPISTDEYVTVKSVLRTAELKPTLHKGDEGQSIYFFHTSVGPVIEILRWEAIAVTDFDAT